MAEEAKRRADGGEQEMGDVTEICPSCGARGVWQKCKLICINPRCGVHIVLACVD